MKSNNIDIVLENQALKAEFQLRNLDLYQIWQPTPDDLERENAELRDLLDWVDQYHRCKGNRKKMEAMGYLFPPISFDIEPDSDWLRFERWLAGKRIRGKLREFLPKRFIITAPENLQDNEIEEALERLIEELAKRHFAVDFGDDMPPRLVYEALLETLEDEFDLIANGCWHLDCCTGRCPACVRRPWCEVGGGISWDEDEQAGYMVFPDSARRYVSPSPVSLTILRIAQEEENRKMSRYMK